MIGSPETANKVLTDATELAKLKVYLLTSLSMDPAAFDGVTFAGDDVVWGAHTVPPEANSQGFIDTYTATYGEPPADVPVAAAYDAVYVTALAAAAATSTSGAAIKDNMFYVANSPGDVANYGGDGFTRRSTAFRLAGEINYIGASGQVDFDANGDASKGGAQTWKVINGQIAPIETRDVDLAAESGDEVPAGELKKADDAPTGRSTIGIIVSQDPNGEALTNAAQLAVDEINAGGGCLGRTWCSAPSRSSRRRLPPTQRHPLSTRVRERSSGRWRPRQCASLWTRRRPRACRC